MISMRQSPFSGDWRITGGVDVCQSEKILRMKNISKSYPGVKALDNAYLELEKGEIHAVIGENGAGKSTLMRILAAIEQRDSGEIILGGKEVNFHSPIEALQAGVSMIHQEVKLMQNLTVEENIWVGRETDFTRFGLIDKKHRRKRSKALLQEIGLEIDLDVRVETLSIAQMQLVELCRAISYNSKIIIMDEPTSSLADTETERLFEVSRSLAQRGISIIFISHKLDELFRICDRITVMRDGQYIGTYLCSDITKNELVSLMVNRTIDNIYPKHTAKTGEVVLKVTGLSSTNGTQNVSFECRSGEILGFSGLMGSGRTEIMRAIFGIDARTSGEIEVKGKKLRRNHTPKDAVMNSIGMVTEDRRKLGCIPTFSVENNISLASLDRIRKMGVFLDKKRENLETDRQIKQLRVKTPNKKQPLILLSGGNQQKAIVGRWLMANPEILILDEPTRGIDVGAKKEIYEIIVSLADAGFAIIIVSSELPEILGMCDRVLVVRNGTIVGEFDAGQTTQAELANCAFGA